MSRAVSQDGPQGAPVRRTRRWLAVIGVVLVLSVVALVVLVTRDGASSPITGWTQSGPAVLELTVVTGPSDEVTGAEVLEETGDAVRLRVRIDLADSQPALAVTRTVTVQLAEPLGDRAVLDHDGTPVPELP